jgi:hypothetical protein
MRCLVLLIVALACVPACNRDGAKPQQDAGPLVAVGPDDTWDAVTKKAIALGRPAFSLRVKDAGGVQVTQPKVCAGTFTEQIESRLETCAVPHLYVGQRGDAHVAWTSVRRDPHKNNCEMARLRVAVFQPGKGLKPVPPAAEWDQQYVASASDACPTAKSSNELTATLQAAAKDIPLCGRGLLSARADVKANRAIAMLDAARAALPALSWSLTADRLHAPAAPCEVR